ncbi:MAG: galactokinase [Ignavibacteriales bacterium]|nr:MAG: galactokinase [Ignavibacteriales bacterium]
MITIRAPFRLPLGGGGTDLPSYYKKHGGFLITSAINKYMFININLPAIFDKIKINYTKVEVVDPQNINEIQHEIVRETLKLLKISRPMEISSMADLSAGTGMGSSSSYTVCLLKGLNTILRRYISIHELAEEACKIEMDLIGKPIGKQDQYATAFGGIIQLDIDKLGNVKVTPLNLDQEIIIELENRLMMFYTNIERDANVILSEQSEKARVDENSTVNSMHIIKEIGYKVKESLLNGNIDNFGKLLHQHWLEKKKISERMSSSFIDEMYSIGLANGALGGKLMGAGGGGFLLFCVKSDNRKKLRTALENMGLKYMNFKFDFEGTKVIANV